jgi:ribosomal 50S subunit-recycling heat shock protein
MKKKGNVKIVLLKGCVVREAGEGKVSKNFKAGDEVTVTQNDGKFLVACGNAADPSVEEGEEAIAELKEKTAADKKAKAAASKSK